MSPGWVDTPDNMSSASFNSTSFLPTPAGQVVKDGTAVENEHVNWNGVFHLIMLSSVSTAGSMGSVFIISAIIVIEPLQVRGNIYLVSLAMANLLVTTLVLPSSCVAILASIPHEPTICAFQWHTTVVCFLVSVLSFLCVAVENFLGLGAMASYELCCGKYRLLSVVAFIWSVSVGYAVSQYVLDLGPSFCKSAHHELWFEFHVAAAAILILLPTILTVGYFTRSLFKLKSFKVRVESLEDPTAFVLTDEFLLRSNIAVFVFLLVTWTPATVVAAISLVRPVSQQLVDTSWCIALANSCLYSYIYAATNRDFRDAFNKLFFYCCCKSHVTFSRRQRENRRAAAGIGLRVHIIPGLNIYAQRKETSSNAVSAKNCKGTSDL